MDSRDLIGHRMSQLQQEAKTRWLKPIEVFFLLQNVREYQYSQETPSTPPSGSILFYNKRVHRYFRQDGYAWRKKKDGKAVGEAHERLKVGNANALNCYYAHGEYNPCFQRRSYWMLDSDRENIVLVHYLDTSESQCLPSGSDGDLVNCDNSYSPLSMLNSDSSVGNNGTESEYQETTSPETISISSQALEALALRKLAAQLSLEDYDDEYIEDQSEESSSHLNFHAEVGHDLPETLFQALEHKKSFDKFDNPHFNSISVFCENADVLSCSDLKEEDAMTWNDMQQSLATGENTEVAPHGGEFYWMSRETNTSMKEVINGDASSNRNVTFTDEAKCWNDFGTSGCNASEATIKKFIIREISPDWAYSSENAKVLITGDFPCASETSWAVMFGSIEVPVDIIQQGVLLCWAPQHPPGNVKICITSGNKEACSEFRDFTYHDKPPATKSSSELLLLVKFVQKILCEYGSREFEIQDGINLELGQLQMQKTVNERLDQILVAVLGSSASPSKIIDLLLEELLRDKLSKWLEERKWNGENKGVSSTQSCIIHMLSGLGYEWALKPVLDSGVGVNFRDANGWTALHWAARFGRENIVAMLLAAGAWAGAVTDSTRDDPLGKTPASIASECGHKGLAGYLAEAALTSHLSSLTTGESEIHRLYVNHEENTVVQNISEKTANANFFMTEDQLSLKDCLGAVRNATQAAARIQSAFRVYSMKKKQLISADCTDAYGMTPEQIHDSMPNRHGSSYTARNQKLQVATLCIQKKFRGWKGRKDFLKLRQNVVKIQAHVRGHQVRKRYKFSMTVSILEMAILRWRRKSDGLRRKQVESADENKYYKEEEEEEEEIVKVFRKQKVDGTIKADLSRVRSMVESLEARQQYRRMLEIYQQVQAEWNGSGILTLNTNYQMNESNYLVIDD